MRASEPHVAGRLEGELGARPDPVWLETDDGGRLSVVWPEGFSVRFNPEPTLFDERGEVKARAGDRIELNQSMEDQTGTYDDPVIAVWFIEDPGCYVYRR